MKVIYRKILDDIIDIQAAAAESHRTIERIELYESEWREIRNELGLLSGDTPKDGDTILGIPILILTKKVLRQRAIEKMGM
jgi:hypothetical protein